MSGNLSSEEWIGTSFIPEYPGKRTTSWFSLGFSTFWKIFYRTFLFPHISLAELREFLVDGFARDSYGTIFKFSENFAS